MKEDLIVWFIDDDESYNYLNERLIKNYHPYIKPLLFNNAKSAITSITGGISNQPDLIFLDWHMPGYGGDDFLKEFFEICPKSKTKIIVTTSTDYIEDINTINSYNIPYIPKPLTMEILEEIFGKRDRLNTVKNMLRFLSKNKH
jgi:two-component SAPR family response regulator